MTVKKMCINHDKLVRDWASNNSNEKSQPDQSETEYDDDMQSDADDSDGEVIPEASDDNAISTNMTVSIIGDNLDKNINPRDMRINNQVQSLHLFHSVATVSRVRTLHLDDKDPVGDLNKLSVAELLPSASDCTAIHDNFVILVARVLVENFKCFSHLRKCVPDHIQHEYSNVMKESTISVSGYKVP